jgi:hypothetical protein
MLLWRADVNSRTAVRPCAIADDLRSTESPFSGTLRLVRVQWGV